MICFVIEDETNILHGIVDVLTHQKYVDISVKGFTCGADLLDYEITEKPDVIFTDIVMPNLSGLDLISKLKESNICKNFVIISGYDKFNYAQKAIRLGVLDYLLKPFKPSEVVDVIRRVYKNMNKVKELKKSRSLPNLPFLSFHYPKNTNSFSYNQIINYLEMNYNTDISLSKISEKIFYHPSYISQLINHYTGKNFSYLIDYFRLHKAAEMLIFEPRRSISQISLLVGYRCERRMYQAFQNRLHMTPIEFKTRYMPKSKLEKSDL